jgi:hypothetical protein
MQMLNKVRTLWLATILFVTLWTVHPLAAQNDQIVVHIDWPNEGETLYAGPSSLLYSVPVQGHVTGRENSNESLVLQLEIIQAGQVLAQAEQQIQAEGKFVFNVTVNPEASMGQFPTEQSGCIAACHFPSELSFPAGLLTLRVSVVEHHNIDSIPDEKQITVDRSAMTTIPVKVVLEGEPGTPVSGVEVSAATRLYLWRSRHELAATGVDGVAHLPVETLHEAPTTYTIQVRPTVVDGVMYENAQYDAARITLPPAAATAPPITITVRGREGEISGKILPSDVQPVPDSVWAICLPDGESFQVTPDQDAAFQFDGLPVNQYRLALDPAWLVAHGQESENVLLNLTEAPVAIANLSFVPTSSMMISGRVVDETGVPLPFAWISMVEQRPVTGVMPFDGYYQIRYPVHESPPLIITAPGFYSGAQPMAEAENGAELEITLVYRPDTQELDCGDGKIVMPDDSQIQLSAEVIHLEYGWLWGDNNLTSLKTIQAGPLTIELTQGRFALDYRPPAQGWFYLPAGEAVVTDGTGEEVTLKAGQMVNLLNQEGLKAVDYAEAVVQILNTDNESPLAARWQPTVQAQVQHRLAFIGIGMAQIITFVTYFLLLLSLLLVPLIVLYLNRRKLKESTGGTLWSRHKEETRG